jgi:pyruvate/2-oxoglutarate/acetoin dehydrogenase E1 component
MSTRELTMLRAINEGLRQLMAADERVFLIGEDIGRHGGSFQATAGLQADFGHRRVVDAPISEAGFTGLAVGAAMTGLRPIVDLMFADFMLLAMDQIVNQAAKYHYMTGGQARVPLVIRAAQGAGQSSAAQHSQLVHAFVTNVPGLKVVLPATPADAKGLLAAAVADPNPVIFLEPKMAYGHKGPVPEELYQIPLGVANVVREGEHVTVVATATMVSVALAAAEALSSEGVQVEVIDPRTLVPLDSTTIVRSAARTGRAVVVDEGPRTYGAGAEIAATIAEQAFDYLEAPVGRVAAPDVPVPFNPNLERAVIPSVEEVVAAIRKVLA